MKLFLSVIICTQNPRIEYLERTLKSLKDQTLEMSEWELIIVDNASTIPVEQRIDLSWHPSGRIVVEPEMGLTNARVKGVAESQGELLVYVDDDNILCNSYLEKVKEIARLYPHVGAFGAAVITPEFEVEPSASARAVSHVLALRDEGGTYWSNDYDHGRSNPFGAGLVIKKEVGLGWVQSLAESTGIKRNLDRKGKSLASAGDLDIAWHAVKMGFGKGVFSELSITHLISAGRVNPSYLAKLIGGIGVSNVLLKAVYGLPLHLEKPCSIAYLVVNILRNPSTIRYTWSAWQAVRSARTKVRALGLKGH